MCWEEGKGKKTLTAMSHWSATQGWGRPVGEKRGGQEGARWAVSEVGRGKMGEGHWATGEAREAGLAESHQVSLLFFFSFFFLFPKTFFQKGF